MFIFLFYQLSKSTDVDLYTFHSAVCRLQELRVQAQAEAQAVAQAQVEELVKKTLEAEREAYNESLAEAIVKERIKTEDQLLMVQLYVSKARH